MDNQLRRPRFWLLVFGCLATLLAGGSAVVVLPFPEPAPSPGALPGPPSPPSPSSPPPGTPTPRTAVTVPPATPPAVVTPTPPPEPSPEAQRTRLLANGRLQPERVRVPRSASGRYAVVPGEAAPPSRRKGKVVRYIVEVERGLPFDPREFADEVHRILNDPRGWGFRFKRVSRGPAGIRVSLSSPALTDRRCLPLRTHGTLSCWNGSRAVLNAVRWNEGVPGYRGDVASYREYVVNHEVGHGLGHGHVPCPGPGRRAPVMLQQTKSLYGCRPNAWPSPKR